MTTRAARARGSEYQEEFFAELREVHRRFPGTFVQVTRLSVADGMLYAGVRMSTTKMRHAEGGMPVRPQEDVVIVVPDTPLIPPYVLVAHDRFMGTPHVLTHRELCIYLDPSREWDPRHGAGGFLDRLYRWFEAAVGGTFDASTALFHAVGGRSHQSSRDESVVCRDELDDPRTVSLAWLSRVHEHRLDLHRAERDGDGERTLVVRAPGPMFTGPGQTVGQVFSRLDALTRDGAFEAWKHRAARKIRERADAVHFVLTVPHPVGGSPHLLVGRVELLRPESARALADLPVEWLRVFDERPSISTRRDKDRPVNAFHQADVVVIGCGGLGSWIAEYIVRAGCRSLELVDYGQVTGGHLVRQNYTEDDVTHPKAQSLAAHLHAIAPTVSITNAVTGNLTARTLEVISEGGFVIDATVSTAMALHLDAAVAAIPDRRATLAQVATDVATGSLGMLVVAPAASRRGVVQVDEAAGVCVRQGGRLEKYATFWEPSEEDELVPARGCSVPTFHGSAADMAAVAAIHTNLIGRHTSQEAAGTYLFALPHTGVEPPLHFIPGDD